MACVCIRKYDFDLSYTSCKDLVYVDRSEFQSEGGTYTLQVINETGNVKEYPNILPGVPVRIDIGKCTSGIFTFAVVLCDKDYSKKRAVLCLEKCGWLKAVAKLGAENPMIRSLDDRISQIDYAVRDDRITVAQDLLVTVRRDLKRINCECACA